MIFSAAPSSLLQAIPSMLPPPPQPPSAAENGHFLKITSGRIYLGCMSFLNFQCAAEEWDRVLSSWLSICRSGTNGRMRFDPGQMVGGGRSSVSVLAGKIPWIESFSD